MTSKQKDLTKNFFALGIMFWLYERSMDPTIALDRRQVLARDRSSPRRTSARSRPATRSARPPRSSTPTTGSSRRTCRPGTYRNITGNEATALGFLAASKLADRPLFYGSYPITPASDILHQLSTYKAFGVKTFQAEDEIAAIGAAIGASYGGSLGMTASSGPGIALKTEAMGLAVMVELPLVVIDVQRAGPVDRDADEERAGGSAPGHVRAQLPTRRSRSWRRRRPGECFDLAIEAWRIALKYMTPVAYLSDAFLATGSEPWRIPYVADLPDIRVRNAVRGEGPFRPYLRDPETLARPWAVPGTAGLEHRIGGLEKADVTGNVSYDPDNHHRMQLLRAGQGRGHRRRHPAPRGLRAVQRRPADPRLGLHLRRDPLRGRTPAREGRSVAHAHLRHLNPFPANTEDVLRSYRRVLIPEVNLGQLLMLVRAKYLIDAVGYDKVRGKPFRIAEIVEEAERLLAETHVMTDTNGHGPATVPAQPPLSAENAAIIQLTRKDFVSDQEVRWCPGCGDYSILAQTQKVMPDFGYPQENIVFISGIGCSGRLPYYMNTFGFHTIHGRAPTLATGLKASRPDLMVWVITGDGDALSIGGNHVIHSMRRNVDINMIMFNNRIYGLTKGQASPTSEFGKRTKSTPLGSVDTPIIPLTIALAAEASFVARSVDTHTEHLQRTLERAGRHNGSCFVEVLQNCNIFNDGAWRDFTDREVREDRMLVLEHGKPMIFGKDRDKGIRLNGLHPEVVTIGQDGVTEADLLVHDETAEDPYLALMLSRMSWPDFPVPVGVLRAVSRPTHDQLIEDQLAAAVAQVRRRATWRRSSPAGRPGRSNRRGRRRRWTARSVGHDNLTGAEVCDNCGADLGGARRPAASRVVPRPAPRASTWTTSGAAAGDRRHAGDAGRRRDRGDARGRGRLRPRRRRTTGSSGSSRTATPW